jgi:hypothetical protein
MQSRKLYKAFGAAVGLIVVMSMGNVQAWTPVKDKLMSIYSWDSTTNKCILDSTNIWQEYPRPQLIRVKTNLNNTTTSVGSWKNLNGTWKYAKQSGLLAAAPTTLSGSIFIPFPLEAGLSGVMDHTGTQYAAYSKTFQLPAGWDTTNYRILLHFGASDFQTRVWVNGTSAGNDNVGGYNSFEYDITNKLANGGTGDQTIAISIFDPTDAQAINPRGKQVSSPPPGGIFYQSTTGPWQTIWLEAVPKTYISDIKITPNVDSQLVHLAITVTGDVTNAKVYAFARSGNTSNIWGGDSLAAAATTNLTIHLSANNLWWPNRAFLYQLGLYIKRNGEFVDSASSYFGQRKVGKMTVGTYTRFALNGVSQFLYGPLDQGFWPDGEYTAPSYAASKSDVIFLKSIGCNMLRKHIKVEPDLFYWACDSLGFIVLQDMPSIGSPPTANSAADINFKFGLVQMIKQRYNHPCIGDWIVYNESWGEPSQTDVTTNVNLAKTNDPTRPVNCATGWNWYPVGDMHDDHDYTDPLVASGIPQSAGYICGNGECGGLLVQITNHQWIPANAHGYGANHAPADAITNLTTRHLPAVLTAKNNNGCCTAVYTETADEETEENGWLTYDRINKYTQTQRDSLKAHILALLDPYTPAAIVNPTATIDPAFFLTTGTINRVNAAAMKIQTVRVTGKAIMIHFAGTDPKAVGDISIVNARGQKIFSSVVNVNGQVNVPTSQMGKGVYFVELNNGITKQRVSCVVK